MKYPSKSLIMNMDNLYKTEKNPWGTKMHDQLTNGLKNMPKGTLLDLGCGDGRDLLPLSELGYECTGIDSSIEALDILKTANPKIKIIHSKIEDIALKMNKKKYDNIISFYTLHFLRIPDALATYLWMQENTSPGGTNLICDFSRLGDLYKEGTDRFYLEDAELKRIYFGWEILDYGTATTKTKAGPMQGIQWILARKPL